MKNNHKKIISITQHHKKNKVENSVLPPKSDDEHKWVEKEINDKLAQLAHIQNQKDTLLKNMRNAIQHEKEMWFQVKLKEQQQAEKLGFKIGYDEGQEKAKQQYEAMLTEANNIVEAARIEYCLTLDLYKNAVIEMIKQTTAELNETECLKQIEQGINQLRKKQHIVISLPPVQYEFVQKRKNELTHLIKDTGFITLSVDPTLEENSCLIIHPHGRVPASIDSSLQQLKQVLQQKI